MAGRARLNCIDHLLAQFPYEPVPHEEIHLPDRVFNHDYERVLLLPELFLAGKHYDSGKMGSRRLGPRLEHLGA